MNLINDCPECGKQLKNANRRCACGWKILKMNEYEKIDNTCGFLLSGEPCKNIGTIALNGRSKKWYCCHHWYDAMFINYKK